jgi:short-subunit dehydrogenase involved in D-alanine esterification of teichoic acids
MNLKDNTILIGRVLAEAFYQRGNRFIISSIASS